MKFILYVRKREYEDKQQQAGLGRRISLVIGSKIRRLELRSVRIRSTRFDAAQRGLYLEDF